MEKNQKIIEILQMIVSNLSQQADGHTIQSRIFASKGYTKLAEKYAEHATEERENVVKCIDRLLDLGCEVKIEAKEEVPVFTDPVEYIKYDLSVSKDEEGLKAMRELIELASKVDYISHDILRDYMIDEEEDTYWMEQQLELIEVIGKQNWLIKQM